MKPFSSSQPKAEKERVRTALVDLAQRRSIIYYGDLSLRIWGNQNAENLRSLAGLLGDISIEEQRRNRGLLSALVVNKKTGIPGPGFFELSARFYNNVPNGDYQRLKWWEKERDRVYDAWSDPQFENRPSRFAYAENRTQASTRTAHPETTPRKAEPDSRLAQPGRPVSIRSSAASVSPKSLNQLMKEAAGYACLQGNKSESDDHEALKTWVSENPGRLGLDDDFIIREEFRFASGDKADVVFEGTGTAAAVEVELAGDTSLMRGLFQVIKYKALMEATGPLEDDPAIVAGFLVASGQRIVYSAYRGRQFPGIISSSDTSRDSATPMRPAIILYA